MGACASTAAVPVADIGAPPSRGNKRANPTAQGVDASTQDGAHGRSNTPIAGVSGTQLSKRAFASGNGGGSMVIKTGGGGGHHHGGGGSVGRGSSTSAFGIGPSSTPGESHQLSTGRAGVGASVSEKLAGLGLGGMRRSTSGNNVRSSTVSLASLQGGHHVDVRSLPELPPAMFLAAIFNDVAFFKVRTMQQGQFHAE
jgi:hypothetical protein